MFNFPIFEDEAIKVRDLNSENSFIRFFHASPNAPAVDIYINNKLAIKNLSFKNFTEYAPLKSSIYNIKVYATETYENPIINKNVFFPPKSIFTLSIVGLLNNLTLLPILDKNIDNRNPSKTYVRFIHLSANTASVDFCLNKNLLFPNIKYGELSEYVPQAPNNYTININSSVGNKNILTSPNANLRADNFYTVYLVGLSNKSPSLQVLIPLDGSSYIKW